MASSKLRSSCSFPKSSPFLLEFHSFYPFLSFFSSHNSPKNASDFNGLCITCRLLHFSPLLLRGLLLPAHSLLFHYPRLSSPRLSSWAAPEHTGLVYKREQRPQRGQASGEIGMRGFDGDAHNAAGGVPAGLESTRGWKLRERRQPRKRSRRIAKVQEESMANVAKIVEIKGKEFDDKMKSKIESSAGFAFGVTDVVAGHVCYY
uniref:Uncharacterized protein n=1 Tax=Salix viminalis TaxID=40686 RepID=A0A6N2KYE2_SALVM